MNNNFKAVVKLFEYMASGNPVISCYLEGIPEEYHKYLIKLNTVSAETIADTVLLVSNMSDQQRKQFGEEAKQFILQAKNKYAQSKKLLGFIVD